MKIYTSYFAKMKKIPENIVKISICGKAPGVACKELNRKFIGIERDEKYFEIAKKCIEEAVKKE